MSHPLLKILEDIQKEYELDLETTREESDITLLVDKREARELAAFEARDLAVATAVRTSAIDLADSSISNVYLARAFALKLGELDLNKIIKGVK